jgi:hypothetical protein
MKLFTLAQGENKDNHAIQRRSSILVFNVYLPFTEENPESRTRPDYEITQKSILENAGLTNIIINSKLTGKKTTDLTKNFNAIEIIKISQTLGFPVLVKNIQIGMNRSTLVSFALPITFDRTSIPFSSTNTLYLSVTNPSAEKIDVFSIDSETTSDTSILRYEREILQAGQRKDYINADNNYINAVLETIHETDVYYLNGEVCQYLPDEFDVLNDFNGRPQLVWNNQLQSNFGNISSVPMIGVRKIAIQGTNSDQNVFFVRNVNLI